MSDQVLCPQTPSQTIGPFFAIGLTTSTCHIDYNGAVTNKITGAGETIAITGKVHDGNGDVINDAMIEIFQADGEGQITSESFLGIARSETGATSDGSYTFQTVKPGPLSEHEAPYIAVIVHLRGLLLQAYTRIYFSDEQESNIKDPVFNRLPGDRRDTLVAARTETSEQAIYEFNIHMQGDNETLFFKL